MKKGTRIRMFLKAGAILTAVNFVIIAFVGIRSDRLAASASASGPSPSFTNAPMESNCTACHTSFPANSGSGNISISGVPANYLPGQQIPITVTVSQSDAVVYGFQMTVVDNQGRMAGSFTATPPQQQIVTGFVNGNQRRYIEHTSDGIIPTEFGSKSWNFVWTAPAQRVGKLGFFAAGNAANSDATTGGDQIYTTSKSSLSGSAISNFDADFSSDVAVYRPSEGVWYSLNSSNGNSNAIVFGLAEDLITPGDYDGDGSTDQAIWRPSNGLWVVKKSGGGFLFAQFGMQGDIPVPGDYDGDLKTDIAVWRPSEGVWYIWRSSDWQYDFRQWGLSADKPVQGDYDADGRSDIAVWRPSEGVWFVWRSSDNNFVFAQFGLSGDQPVPGDYDGDGKNDFAVFRSSDETWYLQNSSGGFPAYRFGLSGDLPVPADYNGDGKTDIAVFRGGTWYIMNDPSGSFTPIAFGFGTDVPIPRGYLPN